MNTTLTAEQVELNAFISAENEAFTRKCRAEGASFWCVFALTAVDLAMYGVYNVEQFKVWRDEVEREESEKEHRKSYGLYD